MYTPEPEASEEDEECDASNCDAAKHVGAFAEYAARGRRGAYTDAT